MVPAGLMGEAEAQEAGHADQRGPEERRRYVHSPWIDLSAAFAEIGQGADLFSASPTTECAAEATTPEVNR